MVWEKLLDPDPRQFIREVLVEQDEKMINSLGILIYNIGPPTVSISVEDEICRREFTLDVGEVLPEEVFDTILMIGQKPPNFTDIDYDAPTAAFWFMTGYPNIWDDEPTSSLLRKYALALGARQNNSATAEQVDLLDNNWHDALEALASIFYDYTDENETPLFPTGTESDRIQYLIFPIQRRFQQLLDGLNPDIEEAA